MTKNNAVRKLGNQTRSIWHGYRAAKSGSARKSAMASVKERKAALAALELAAPMESEIATAAREVEVVKGVAPSSKWSSPVQAVIAAE